MSKRNHIINILFAAAIFFPAFFGFSMKALSAAAVLAVLILILVLRWRKMAPLEADLPASSLILFLIWAVLQTALFSDVKYFSLTDLLPLLSGGVLYFLVVQKWEDRKFLSFLIVAGTCVIAVVGLIFFLQSEFFGRIRLSSTFYHHNGLAGFLILPFMISLSKFFEKREYGKILVAASAVLIALAFILTFSRGGYLSAAVSLAVFIVLLFARRRDCGFSFKPLLKVCTVLGVAGALALGAMELKSLQANRLNGSEIGVYNTVAEDDSAMRARLEYMKLAAALWEEKPVVGYGLGTFGTEARRVQKDVRFFSNDPHNVYLRFFAELGLIGGLLWLTFLAGVLWRGARAVLRSPNITPLDFAFFAGFTGMLAHNAIDFDFRFGANVLLFFMAAAVVGRRETADAAGQAASESEDDDIASVNNFGTRIFFLSLLVPGIFFVTSFAAGENYFKSALKELAKNASASLPFHDILRICTMSGLKDTTSGSPLGPSRSEAGPLEQGVSCGKFFSLSATVQKKIEKAKSISPTNPQYPLELSRIRLSENMLDEAQSLLDRSMRLFPDNREAFLVGAKIALAKKNPLGAEDSLIRAIELAPYKDLVAVAALSELYRLEARKGDMRSIIEEALKRFPEEAFTSELWIDPGKNKIKTQRDELAKAINIE